MQLTLKEIYQSFAEAEIYCAGTKVGSTDKGTTHSYIDVYEYLFAPYRNKKDLRILEIGVERGASLLLWTDYFSDAYVTGVDLSDTLIDPKVRANPRIQIVLTDATKPECLSVIPGEFDIVIDDGSHNCADQLSSFRLLFPLVRIGGLYVIEDINSDASAAEIQRQTSAEILDLRKVKGRFDDILALARKI